MIAMALRSTAIVVALAAVVDPAVMASGRMRPRLSIVLNGSRPSAAAQAVRRALEARLDSQFQLVDGVDSESAHTIVIGRRYPDAFIGGRASTVTLDTPTSSDARLAAVDAPASIPPATSVHLIVDVIGGVKNTTSTLIVSTSGIESGRASHAWTGGPERWRADLDVVPVTEPPFVFHVEVSSRPEGQADVMVGSRRDPLRVLLYELRPSWATTFVRRALESDGRFQVSAVTDISRGIQVRAGQGVALEHLALDDVDTVIVGGLDRLSAVDVAWLGRFMGERGGSVALIPDGRVANPAWRTFVGDDVTIVERLLEHPAPLMTRSPLPRLDASELLTFTSPDAQTIAAASGSGAPVVITLPKAGGQLLLSGALDAWRYRADSGVQFDRFWQTAIAGLAMAARPSVEINIAPAILAPGETGRLTARVRRSLSSKAVSARIVDGDVVRLWPSATVGEFTGTFSAPPDAGAHAMRVSARGVPERFGSAPFVVGRGDAVVAEDRPPLALLSRSHDGIEVDEHHLDQLEAFIRAQTPAPPAPVARHPFRSAWWLVMFSACLSGEWWLRRQNGLR